MIWRPNHLTRAQREERRLEAGRLLQTGQVSQDALARRLKALGWSPQCPAAYAKERNDELVRAWLRHDWPRINKRLVAQGRRSSLSMRRGFHFRRRPVRRGHRMGTPMLRRLSTRREL